MLSSGGQSQCIHVCNNSCTYDSRNIAEKRQKDCKSQIRKFVVRLYLLRMPEALPKMSHRKKIKNSGDANVDGGAHKASTLQKRKRKNDRQLRNAKSRKISLPQARAEESVT